ncbi:tyrosine-type recombinase/integrase [Glutamicibacter sp. X7]
MATISERKQKSGAVSYRVQWRDPDEGLMSRTFPDPDKAKDLQAFLNANGNSFKLANEAKGRVKSKAPSVREIIDRHIDGLGGNIEPGTARDYRSFARRHFTDLGGIPVDQLTTSHVRTWFDAMALAPKSKKNVHALLSAALRTELRRKDSWIEANVAEGIRTPKSTKKTRDPVFLSKDELQTLIDALPSEVYRRMIDLKAYTGLRFGEITALRRSHVRFVRGRYLIDVREAWKRHAGKEDGQPLGAPKTSKGTRTVTLGKAAAERFVPWLEKVKGDDLIFTVPSTGSQITSSYFSRIIWRPTIDTLMKPAEGGKPKLHARPTPHDMRHTHASMLIEAGVDLPTIQERLGHESITTTIGTYGHLRFDADANAADALD